MANRWWCRAGSKATSTATTYQRAGGALAPHGQGLAALGVQPGERVATMAWNGYRHMELYYAVSGSRRGAAHAQPAPAPGPDGLHRRPRRRPGAVLRSDLPAAHRGRRRAHRDDPPFRRHDRPRPHARRRAKVPNLLCYEDLLAAQDDSFVWPSFDENLASSSLCYTSGTTGNPKGVLYSHRSTLLHTFAIALPDALELLGRRHHPAGGADVPRQRLGPAVHRLHERRQAGLSRGRARRQEPLRAVRRPSASRCRPACPRCGRALLAYVESNGLQFSTMRRTVIGGSACPPAMMRKLRRRLRRARAARLGHDRDEPGGHRAALQAQARWNDVGRRRGMR